MRVEHQHLDGMICERTPWGDWRVFRNPRGQHSDEAEGLFMTCLSPETAQPIGQAES